MSKASMILDENKRSLRKPLPLIVLYKPRGVRLSEYVIPQPGVNLNDSRLSPLRNYFTTYVNNDEHFYTEVLLSSLSSRYTALPSAKEKIILCKNFIIITERKCLTVKYLDR